MSNKDIAEVLEMTSKLITLHGGDENRAKVLGGVSFNLERSEENLSELTEAELQKIRGVGKSIASLILEIKEKGTTQELLDLYDKTPEGVLEMFKVKGLGVKKIKMLWEELGIDNLNDLQIACESGKIAQIKGFGEKTQVSILASLALLRTYAGKVRMNEAWNLSAEIERKLQHIWETVKVVGAVPRALQEVDTLSFLVAADFTEKLKLPEEFKENLSISSPYCWRGTFLDHVLTVSIRFCNANDLVAEQVIETSGQEHLNTIGAGGKSFYHYLKTNNFDTEEAYYEGFTGSYIVPEMRDSAFGFEWAKENTPDSLISMDDLKGTVHNHSTYSDGRNSLIEMAKAAQDMGLSYFGIADHSQTAAYANGLLPNRVLDQHKEIDQLNAGFTDFKILKGIESDILSNGDLDYEADLLKEFDYVVASVHANLSMSEEKANERLIKAIENPYTTILGHPTGRLILSRSGYPIDHKKIIDACAANGVVMEVNASPYRLDIDWKWMPYCIEKGVLLSINPDAHSTVGLLDMHYGVAVCRKAGVKKEHVFNALTLPEIQSYLTNRKALK